MFSGWFDDFALVLFCFLQNVGQCWFVEISITTKDSKLLFNHQHTCLTVFKIIKIPPLDQKETLPERHTRLIGPKSLTTETQLSSDPTQQRMIDAKKQKLSNIKCLASQNNLTEAEMWRLKISGCEDGQYAPNDKENKCGMYASNIASKWPIVDTISSDNFKTKSKFMRTT